MRIKTKDLQNKIQYLKNIFISKNFTTLEEWDSMIIEEDKLDFILSKRNMRGYKQILENRNSLKSVDEFFNLLKRLDKLGTTISFERYEIYYGNEKAIIIWEENKHKRGVTLENLILKYGHDLGERKFKEYCEKQAHSNSYEYKLKTGKVKSIEEFNDFNKSRAVTYENLLKKYDEEEATKRWNQYREKQAYTNTKEHLGERYEYINFLKGHTLDAYLIRYQDEEIAIQKLSEYYSKNTLNYSKISQDLFRKLIELEPFSKHLDSIYFAEYNKEYGVYNDITRKYNLYDFVCTSLRIVIEFHGDHYHGNPKIYRPQQKLRGRGCTQYTAEERWAYDEEKKNNIIRNRNFHYVCVWESDYKNDPEATLKRVFEYVNANCL